MKKQSFKFFLARLFSRKQKLQILSDSALISDGRAYSSIARIWGYADGIPVYAEPYVTPYKDGIKQERYYYNREVDFIVKKW